MAKQRWGRQTRVKFIGGEFLVSMAADKSAIDYQKDLNGVIARSTDMTPAMLKVGRYLLGVNLRNFRAEGRPKWQPLTPATIQDRIRKGFGPGPILQRTQKLMKSLTEEGAPFQIFKARPRSLLLSSRVQYFEFHQKGTRFIPKREMLGYQRQDKSQITRIINDFVKGDVF
jgi:phage gpG-like protein